MWQTSALALAISLMGLTGCGQSDYAVVDGSDNVFMMSTRVQEMQSKERPDTAQVIVNKSGTGAGFHRLSLGEVNIVQASRRIEPSEAEALKNQGEFFEFTVGYDAMVFITHKKTSWIDGFTFEQLKAIWNADSTIKRWNQIEPSFPQHEIQFYGPRADSNTFRQLSQHPSLLNGGSVRRDIINVIEPNFLIHAVRGDEMTLGLVSSAYAFSNRNTLKLLAVGNSPSDMVLPTDATLQDGTYPLRRPLYLYAASKQTNLGTAAQVLDYLCYYMVEYPKRGKLAPGMVFPSAEQQRANRDKLKRLAFQLMPKPFHHAIAGIEDRCPSNEDLKRAMGLGR